MSSTEKEEHVPPKVVKFIAADEWASQNLAIPSPASKELPEWYKETNSYFHGNSFEFSTPGNSANTIKSCMPVLDILSTGWIQKTWCDIYVEKTADGQTMIHHSMGNSPIGSKRVETLGNMPIPKGYVVAAFHWRRPWYVQTPPGHSMLFTHPFYRTDLPFQSISAVIDSDDYNLNGKVGFLLKEDFTGLIPKGTPMYQMIPFQKDSWVGVKEKNTPEFKERIDEQTYEISSVFTGGYKKTYWNRPDFSNES
jgi:hypothetical protein